MAAMIKAESPGTDPSRCNITWASYSGDEGGILCKLDFGQEEGVKAFLVSITHLVFDRKAPLAREIAAYQKHRVKRLRRLGNPANPGPEHPGA
ncbi:MAG TPA: hypothetical protein VGV37_13975 [Aliidongia sp.]|uniref:hypothetical protein n=1 Tax=Aliidongia sp. TaxID=1914230 RepID=UPI002DDCEF13|nr:hypothetical protein [Aliidongia sp.]HEV2675648.1 hypothetical protein [Aliidongia sp.]